MTHANRLSATDYDQNGQRLRRVRIDNRAATLWFLTNAQLAELAEGREVIVITPRGERTDIGGRF